MRHKLATDPTPEEVVDTSTPPLEPPPKTLLPPIQAPVPDFPKFLTPAWFLELCCGDQDAATVAETLTRDAHLTDDICDGDKRVTDEDLVYARLVYLQNLTLSPFWQKHGAVLMPIFTMGASAFVDANRWAKDPDVRLRLASDVLKSQYADAIYYFALLTGGYHHMRRFQSRYRAVDCDVPEWAILTQTQTEKTP